MACVCVSVCVCVCVCVLAAAAAAAADLGGIVCAQLGRSALCRLRAAGGGVRRRQLRTSTRSGGRRMGLGHRHRLLLSLLRWCLLFHRLLWWNVQLRRRRRRRHRLQLQRRLRKFGIGKIAAVAELSAEAADRHRCSLSSSAGLCAGCQPAHCDGVEEEGRSADEGGRAGGRERKRERED